jgi:GNAT superfamily N-acetyltransferase
MHPASEAERPEVFRNVHDVWGRGLPVEEHVRRRLASVQHNRAVWHCGTIGGRVVVSLGCYPLSFHVEGRVASGFAIGAVHTVADHRRRGYAARLIRHVESAEHARGAEIALLYSDIDPRYYHRQGYRRCPSWEGVATPASLASVPQEPAAALVDLAADSPEPAAIYEACHGSSALAIARPPDYWTYLVAKSPGDRFLGLPSGGEIVGYARIHATQSRWRLCDWAVRPPRESHLDTLLGGVSHRAASEGVERIVGWIPREPAFTRRFAVEPRRTEITMIKLLGDDPEITPSQRAAAESFLEIDHV